MLSRSENNQSNQTEFVDQGPLWENQSINFLNFKNLKKNKNILPFYVLFAFLFLIAVILIFNVIFANKTEEQVVKEAVEEVIELDPLNQRVNELREDLKTHDPTKQILPFPQVDLTFNID
jgi:hypothetical protein